MDNWAVVTTLKKNESTMQSFRLFETFINFYKEVWGINKFVFIIGIAENLEARDIINRIFSFVKNSKLIRLEKIKFNNLSFFKDPVYYEVERSKYNDISIDLLLYTTNVATTWQEWDLIKRYGFRYTNHFLHSKYDKIINIDCDEFLYVNKEKENLKELNERHFHYVEYVPDDIFDIKNDMIWSVQPWFDRIQFRNWDFNMYHHGVCKLFWFERQKSFNLAGWCHKNSGEICSMIGEDVKKDIKEIEKILKENYYAFHMSTLDKEYFLKSKGVKFSHRAFMKSSMREEKELIKFYNSCCAKTEFPIIINNVMKRYIKSERI